MSQSEDVLQRFLDALVEQIAADRPEYLTGPFTVAEIYQDLVPYRSHRDLIGVEMNGDYEDALARMLSGEGDYLLLDSEVARRELRAELSSPNPNTALFREFAAVDVRLHPSRVPAAARVAPGVAADDSETDTVELDAGSEADVEPEPEPTPDVELEMEAPGKTLRPTSAERAGKPRSKLGGAGEDGVVGHIETVTAPPVVSLSESASDGSDSTAAGPVDVVTVCHWCREDLPARDSIHFCPFCGSDLRPSPCRECGEAMEARWQFCPSCGADVRA